MLDEAARCGWKRRQIGVRPDVVAVRVDAFARQHREQCGGLAGDQAVDEELRLVGGQAEDGVLKQVAGHLGQGWIPDGGRLGAGQGVFAAGCAARPATAPQGDEQTVERARKDPDAPRAQASPIDGTRQPLEPWSCIPADDAVGLTAGFQGVGKPDFGVARLGAELRFRDFALFQRPIEPGNEQHVSQARLDRARARKEVIGDGIPDRPQPQLVAGLALLKERHDALRALPLGFIEIDPGKRRHGLRPPRSRSASSAGRE